MGFGVVVQGLASHENYQARPLPALLFSNLIKVKTVSCAVYRVPSGSPSHARFAVGEQ